MRRVFLILAALLTFGAVVAVAGSASAVYHDDGLAAFTSR